MYIEVCRNCGKSQRVLGSSCIPQKISKLKKMTKSAYLREVVDYLRSTCNRKKANFLAHTPSVNSDAPVKKCCLPLQILNPPRILLNFFFVQNPFPPFSFFFFRAHAFEEALRKDRGCSAEKGTTKKGEGEQRHKEKRSPLPPRRATFTRSPRTCTQFLPNCRRGKRFRGREE